MVKKFKQKLPALINIRTCRDTWHVGTGTDGEPEWNRYEITKKKLKKMFTEKKIDQIENREKLWAEKLIKKRLQKL